MRSIVCIIVLALPCGLMSESSVSAELDCVSDGAFLRSGVSPHKECIAEHVPEFADYSNLLNGCRLKVYVTDVATKKVLEDHLRAPYGRYLEQRPWCEVTGESTIEFAQVRYPLEQMMAWKAAAEGVIRGVESESLGSVLFCDAKLHVQVRSDAAKRDLVGALADGGVPEDAYVLGPDEPNVPGRPTIGLPTLRGSENKEVSLPVALGTDEPVGELIIGRTELRLVTDILPPCPGHGPPVASRTTSRPQEPATTGGESAETSDSILYTYIPAQASMELRFNRNMQLVGLTYLMEESQEGLWKLIEEISEVVPLERIYADDRIVFFAGESGAVFVALGAERDWYDKPYRISLGYAYVSRPQLGD